MPCEYCDKCNAELEDGQIGLCDSCQGGAMIRVHMVSHSAITRNSFCRMRGGLE